MNVDEAMKVAKREVLGWFDDTHTAAPILAAEVERLRGELAATKCALDNANEIIKSQQEIMFSYKLCFLIHWGNK